MADPSPVSPRDRLRPLLTVADVAKILNLHSRSIRRLIADGRLPVVRLGGAVRIRPEAIEELIASGGQGMAKGG
jgi:excisionase family DNA binding protein